MRKILVVILAVVFIAGVCSAPAAAAGKALTYNELYEMIQTADFICDMHYGDEFDGRGSLLLGTLSRMFPESERPYDDEKHFFNYVFVTEEQLWAGINAEWPGASEAMIKQMLIPDVLYEEDNGHYVIYFPARGGYGFYKDGAKGEFIGYTANDDGTYSVYFKVPLPDEEVEIAGLDDLASELGWPDLIEYNGTTYINNEFGYSTIKYENRVFVFKLTDGEADYISDEWVTELPDKLVPMPEESLKGDIDGDGEANNKDVVKLFRYVSSGKTDENESLYDFNGDGEVNNKDVVAVFRFLSTAEKTEETSDSEPEESVTEPEESSEPEEESSEPEEESSEPEEESSEPEEESSEPEESETEEIIVPDKTLTYVTADVYADEKTADDMRRKKAGNNLLSKWFAEKVELDPVTWDPMAPAGFDSVSEFVIRRAQGQYIEEVTVLKVKEGGSVEDVIAMAEFRRVKEQNNADYTLYDDEDHRNANMLNSGVVENIGDFVVYIVTEDTETSVLRAKSFVQKNPGCSAEELYKAIVIEEN